MNKYTLVTTESPEKITNGKITSEYEGRNDKLQSFLASKNNPYLYSYALHQAIGYQQDEIVKALIESGKIDLSKHIANIHAPEILMTPRQLAEDFLNFETKQAESFEKDSGLRMPNADKSIKAAQRIVELLTTPQESKD